MVECFCIDHLDVCFKFTVLLCNQHQELMCFLFTACYMAGFLCPSVNYDVLKLKIMVNGVTKRNYLYSIKTLVIGLYANCMGL